METTQRRAALAQWDQSRSDPDPDPDPEPLVFQMFQVKMKLRLVLAVALLCALMNTGESIKCFSCRDYSGSCSKTRDCSQDDACLTLKARGGDTYRSCVKYSECDFNSLSFVYPTIPSFTFSCCNSDLCNSAPVASASLLIGLLCSLLAVWWTAL